jgi:hypothetical protein
VTKFGVTSLGARIPEMEIFGAAQKSGFVADKVFVIPDVVSKSWRPEFSVESPLW